MNTFFISLFAPLSPLLATPSQLLNVCSALRQELVSGLEAQKKHPHICGIHRSLCPLAGRILIDICSALEQLTSAAPTDSRQFKPSCLQAKLQRTGIPATQFTAQTVHCGWSHLRFLALCIVGAHTSSKDRIAGSVSFAPVLHLSPLMDNQR